MAILPLLEPLSGTAAPLLEPLALLVPELLDVPLLEPLAAIPLLLDPELPVALPLLGGGAAVAVPLEPAPELPAPDPELVPDAAGLPVPVGAAPESSSVF